MISSSFVIPHSLSSPPSSCNGYSLTTPKKWDGGVGRPEIQKFVGALHGQRARKGIFITTSDFSNNAREYVSNIDSKVVLIDGKQLAEFMIDHNIGVSKVSAYEIKKIDTDYFVEV